MLLFDFLQNNTTKMAVGFIIYNWLIGSETC